jgi:hypothetical protein
MKGDKGDKGDPGPAGQLGDIFPKLALCGSSMRDVRDFVPNGSHMVVVESCTPSPTVAAMLVARGGHAAIEATALQNYLEAGGIVITEFGSSIPVYNKVFGTDFAVPEFGTFIGGCYSNVGPLVQLTSWEDFWGANMFVAETQPGCGYNLAGLPDITPLGSASLLPDTVTLAYVKKGLGRLWLVESNWSDNQNFFNQRSERLMRYMVKTR